MATTMAAAESEEKKGGNYHRAVRVGGGGQRGTFCLLLTQLKWTEIGAIARRPRAEADWWADGRAVNVLIRRHCFRVMRAEEEGRRRHHHYHGIHREIERLWRCSRLRRRMWEAE